MYRVGVSRKVLLFSNQASRLVVWNEYVRGNGRI